MPYISRLMEFEGYILRYVYYVQLVLSLFIKRHSHQFALSFAIKAVAMELILPIH